MKNKKEIFLLLFLLIQSFAYSLSNKKYAIPFWLENNTMYIDCKIGKKDFTLVFDTGGNRATLNSNGIDKLFGSLQNFFDDYAYEYLKFKGFLDGMEESEENHLYLGEEFSFDYNVSRIEVGKYKGKNIQFELMPQLTQSEFGEDGIVNHSIFSDVKNITIDFVKKQIVLNDSPINDDGVPMRPIFNSFEIPVKIDGNECWAEIDTGADQCWLKAPQTKHIDKRNIEQYNDFIRYGTIEKRPAEDMVYKVEIGGSTFENVNFIYATDERFYSPNNTDKNLKFLSLSNTLGVDFFKDKVIQMDFENMVFRIK